MTEWSYEEFVDYCLKQNADVIYVRAILNNKWQSVPLSALSREDALAHVFQWWAEGRMPLRLLES